MKVLKKTIKILEILLDAENELSLVELSDLSGLHHSNVYRIVSDLVEAGYLKQKHKRGKYSIGYKFLEFASIIKKDLQIADLARPIMVDLHNITKETVNLSVLHRGEVIGIETVQTNHTLQVISFFEGNKMPLYCSGHGKVFLAYMNEEEQKKYLKKIKIHQFTPNTITDKRVLKNHLLSIRKDGIACNDEEHDLGVRGTSAPIKDYTGKVVAAMGIVAPTLRFTMQKISEYTPILKSHALQISGKLGYKDK